MAEVKYGEISSWDFSLTRYDFFNKYLSSYMKMKEQDVLDVRKNIKYTQANGEPVDPFTSFNVNGKVITLTSGTQIFFNTTYISLSSLTLAIDINGYKKPNRFGRDIFFLTISKDYGVIPFSRDSNEEINPNKTRKDIREKGTWCYRCYKNAGGAWCAALIMIDGWEIKDDYPW